jgi:hypothetical protein
VTLTLPRFAGIATAALAAVCAAGAWPTWRVAGTDGLVALATAAGISLVAAVVSYLPSASAVGGKPQARLQAAMLGIGVRLFVMIAGTFAVLALDALPARMPFAIWMGIDYATLLLVETRTVLRTVGRPEGERGPASA